MCISTWRFPTPNHVTSVCPLAWARGFPFLGSAVSHPQPPDLRPPSCMSPRFSRRGSRFPPPITWPPSAILDEVTSGCHLGCRHFRWRHFRLRPMTDGVTSGYVLWPMTSLPLIGHGDRWRHFRLGHVTPLHQSDFSPPNEASLPIWSHSTTNGESLHEVQKIAESNKIVWGKTVV